MRINYSLVFKKDDTFSCIDEIRVRHIQVSFDEFERTFSRINAHYIPVEIHRLGKIKDESLFVMANPFIID